MTFYDKYIDLCAKANVKPYALVIQLGAKDNSIVKQWSKGSTPRKPMLQKIADYFNVPVSYFFEDGPDTPGGIKNTPVVSDEGKRERINKIIDAMDDDRLDLVLMALSEDISTRDFKTLLRMYRASKSEENE